MRVTVPLQLRAEVTDFLASELEREVTRKGDGAFYTYHEALGVIEEERDELLEAIRSNNLHQIRQELRDLIVAALWGLVSIRAWETSGSSAEG